MRKLPVDLGQRILEAARLAAMMDRRWRARDVGRDRAAEDLRPEWSAVRALPREQEAEAEE